MPSARARTHAGTTVWAAPLRLAIMAIHPTPPSIIAMPSPGINRQKAVRALASAKDTPDAPVPEDIAMLMHTSGTTSRPKAVPLTHANLMASVRNISAHYALSPADTGLVVMPLFHGHGLIGATLSSLLAGAKLVLPQRFSAHRFWPMVAGHTVTWYSAVPTIHEILLVRADSDHAPSRS